MTYDHLAQRSARQQAKTKSLPLTLATSAAAGAFMLLRPADWPAPLRWAYLAAPGVLVSAASALLLLFKGVDNPQPQSIGTPDSAAERSFQRLRATPPAARMGMSLGLGMMITGSQALSLSVDKGIEKWLHQRGLTHPRRWMAAATALAMVTSDIGKGSTSPSPDGSDRKD